MGTVGEEGLGDLRGVRHFFSKGEYRTRVRHFFSMDGNDPNRITHRAVGSKRYRVTFKGPGGHSYRAFGLVNPMAAMSQAVVNFYTTPVPTTPHTTYSASVTGGGTSVNAIPNEVFMEFDMRSEDPTELAKVERGLLSAVSSAVEGENRVRSTTDGVVTAEPKMIGDRPAGATPRDAPIVRLAGAAAAAHGFVPEYDASSTDSNVPISLGVPAVTLSPGPSARTHSLEEYTDVSRDPGTRAIKAALATVLAVSEPR